MPRKPSYVVNYMPQLIRDGFTATEALDELRSRGHSIADKTFYRAWGETVDQLEKMERMSDLPLNRRPTPDYIGTATRPSARGYLYNVEVAVHDPHTGEVSFHAHGLRTQKLISIGNALQQAVIDFAERQEGQRGSIPGRILGGVVSSVLHLVGEDEE